ncbi:MAG: YgiT-type zinc finger protein, partial [bacterium]|nr:YgiT-type zinc finger protein [bacterium]
SLLRYYRHCCCFSARGRPVAPVPAWVCAQCGEPYFEAREVEIMQRTATVLDEQQAAFLADAA